MDVTARWRQLLQGPGVELHLDEAALLIAACANPGLDVADMLAQLDEIAAGVGVRDVDGVCRMLFGTLGLRGDEATYDDPRNSFLDEILQRRLGIPISLSVLLIEIGRRCGLSLQGVGMPGHFLVRDPSDPGRLIDAFSAGRRLDREDCRELLQRVSGPAATLEPEMLEPTGKRAILARMLANLDRSYAQRTDHRSLTWVCRLRSAIPDLAPAQRIDIANRLTGLGAHREAADLLEEIGRTPGVSAQLARRLTNRATRLRSLLN